MLQQVNWYEQASSDQRRRGINVRVIRMLGYWQMRFFSTEIFMRVCAVYVLAQQYEEKNM